MLLSLVFDVVLVSDAQAASVSGVKIVIMAAMILFITGLLCNSISCTSFLNLNFNCLDWNNARMHLYQS